MHTISKIADLLRWIVIQAQRWLRTRPVLWWESRRTNARLRSDGRRGLFLDCGSNIGQGFTIFRAYYPPDQYDYELFEPNPNCVERLEEMRSRLGERHRIVIHPVAVGTEEGEAEFFGTSDLEGGPLSEGGSLLADHNSRSYRSDAAHALRVRTISFADLVERRSETYRTIVVKMDIEGEEVPVLEDLLDRGLAGRIDTLFVELHADYRSEPDASALRSRELALLGRLRQTSCRVHVWY